MCSAQVEPYLCTCLLLRYTAAAQFHATSNCSGAKVAVVLSGCGVYDGTEIHEASAILVHLSRGGAEVQMFAPDVSQMHVIDHGKGQPVENESRNVLSESARIARGSITDLAKLNVSNHDAVIFPGGFGAAKNLSTFAIDGKDCKVNKEVERVLKDFHDAGKPIGLCCISPVLAAKVLPGVDVTVGHEEEEGGKWPYAGTTQAITALGAKHTVKEVTEAHVDKKNKVVTTPAFMCETKLHLIFDGIGAMARHSLMGISPTLLSSAYPLPTAFQRGWANKTPHSANLSIQSAGIWGPTDTLTLTNGRSLVLQLHVMN
uniref:Glutamine amidotransferase class 1 domain containing 3 n=1 Tax=Cyprinus carpio carpio TaxID=630221 RepID=A0A9J7XF46_CYPCA